MHLFHSSAVSTLARKQNPRTCSSVGHILSIQSPSSFHRQFSTRSCQTLIPPRAGPCPASKRFYHSALTFQFALASNKPTEKSILRPLHHSTSAIIASHRTEAIARHLSTGASPPPDPSSTMSYSKQPSEFQPRRIGALHTLDFRCYIEKDGTPVSPFHDVPLYANEQQTILNMVVEIPRWSNAKLEVSLSPRRVRQATNSETDLQGRVPESHQARH